MTHSWPNNAGGTLIDNPSSFAATILKKKYFPRTSLWDATVPANASFTWRSVLSARELLQQGLKWVVGDGRTVLFWKDKWLNEVPGGRIFSVPPTDDHANSTVADWRLPDGSGWREEELANLLSQEELRAVKQTHIAESGLEDFLSWTHTKNGEFTVRSAYHLEMERRSGGTSTSVPGQNRSFWKKLWQANVPPKVKNLMWRAVSKGLPTMSTLARR